MVGLGFEDRVGDDLRTGYLSHNKIRRYKPPLNNKSLLLIKSQWDGVSKLEVNGRSYEDISLWKKIVNKLMGHHVNHILYYEWESY